MGNSANTRGDAGLDAVATWFRGRHHLRGLFASLLRQALDDVLDGPHTGRFDVRELEQVERDYLGTRFRILLRSWFDLPRGRGRSVRVDGHDVDTGFSLGGSWTVRSRRVHLLASADDHNGTFDVGLIAPPRTATGRARSPVLVTDAGITWLARTAQLPDNPLLRLPPEVRRAITEPDSGQQRVNALFRLVQGQVVERATVITVAVQADGLKRCREARDQLAPEGVVVLGHGGDCPRVAEDLGLPVPRKGTFLALRLVPVAPLPRARRTTRIDGPPLRGGTAVRPEAPAPAVKC
ncbi:hypothetical protein K7G98_07575 [Saccharothrix sp. MB29]|nr:hypothetical protein [Saccharothrix sp. MB29]